LIEKEEQDSNASALPNPSNANPRVNAAREPNKVRNKQNKMLKGRITEVIVRYKKARSAFCG
jgi:hypothetical protein